MATIWSAQGVVTLIGAQQGSVSLNVQKDAGYTSQRWYLNADGSITNGNANGLVLTLVEANGFAKFDIMPNSGYTSQQWFFNEHGQIVNRHNGKVWSVYGNDVVIDHPKNSNEQKFETVLRFIIDNQALTVVANDSTTPLKLTPDGKYTSQQWHFKNGKLVTRLHHDKEAVLTYVENGQNRYFTVMADAGYSSQRFILERGRLICKHNDIHLGRQGDAVIGVHPGSNQVANFHLAF